MQLWSQAYLTLERNAVGGGGRRGIPLVSYAVLYLVNKILILWSRINYRVTDLQGILKRKIISGNQLITVDLSGETATLGAEETEQLCHGWSWKFMSIIMNLCLL